MLLIQCNYAKSFLRGTHPSPVRSESMLYKLARTFPRTPHMQRQN